MEERDAAHPSIRARSGLAQCTTWVGVIVLSNTGFPSGPTLYRPYDFNVVSPLASNPYVPNTEFRDLIANNALNTADLSFPFDPKLAIVSNPSFITSYP